MFSEKKDLIGSIRRFNRFYTNILGLLDRHLLDSEFSLPQLRVLYEIGNKPECTAKLLVESLKVDPGYLSRIIRNLENAAW